MKKFLLMMGIVMLLSLGALHAWAEEAADITQACQIDVSVYKRNMHGMLDDDTLTKWETGNNGGFVEVKTPSGICSQGVYVQWGKKPADIWLQAPSQDGKTWVNVQKITGDHYNRFISFDVPMCHFRLCTMNGEDKLSFIRMQVMGEGELPEWVQRWQPFEGKADLMVLVAHPDDELLFMGGIIPYYNTVQGKKVIVVYIASMPAHRKVELLNGLWHCGVRMYPEMPTAKFRDKNTMDRKECLNLWEEKVLLEHVTGMIRKYQPDVIVTHDINGEYGHGAHKACNWAVRYCIERAASPNKDMQSFSQYGAWQVKKVYFHLYDGKKNLGQIQFDWQKPEEAFGGKNMLTVAAEAFEMHQSQSRATIYAVRDFGPYDNSKFGLYYSTVGPDSGKNDLFENIE